MTEYDEVEFVVAVEDVKLPTLKEHWSLLGLDFDGDPACMKLNECGGYPVDGINWDLMPDPPQHEVSEEQATMTWIWWHFVRPHFGLDSFEEFMAGQVLELE